MNNLKMGNAPLSVFIVKEIRSAMLESVNRLKKRNFSQSSVDKEDLLERKRILTLSAEQMLKLTIS